VDGLAVFLRMSGCVVRMSLNCGEFMTVFGLQVLNLEKLGSKL